MANRINELLKNYSLEDCYALESETKEFAILEKLFKKLKNKEVFLPLILLNSVVCYNLSKASEDYWDEFIEAAGESKIENITDIFLFFVDFLPQSRWNNKSVWLKIKKIKKLKPLLVELYHMQMRYYKDMNLLARDISRYTQTLFDDYIIIYTIKMYAFWARIRLGKYIHFPYEILFTTSKITEELYERHKYTFFGAQEKFYLKLSKELEIPPLHLELLLKREYKELMKVWLKK